MTTDSLIDKLEAKICGNYTAKEAYGRGLDSGLQIAIEIIRQHTAAPDTGKISDSLRSAVAYAKGDKSKGESTVYFPSEISVVDEESAVKIMTAGIAEFTHPDMTAGEAAELAYKAIRPYLATREPVSGVEDCNSCKGTGRVFVRRNSKGEIDYIDGARTGELVNCDVCRGEGKR